MFRHLVIAPAVALFLAGCASSVPVAEQPPAAPPVDEPTPVEEVVERAIPDDSVYPLLVAEFALRRRAYDVALENYLNQSQVLRDAGISAHTTHLAQFMQREPEALEAVQLWVELEPDSAEANNTLATLLARQGRTVQALPHLSQVARLGATANFPMLLNGFSDLDNAQQAALVQGINELAAEFPDNTQLLLSQALIHTEFEQFDPALEKLNRLFELEPWQHQALLLEAKVLLSQGVDQPFDRMQRALEAKPQDKRLRLQYARLLTNGDMPAAREQFEILLAQSPRDGDLLLSLALINREIGDDLEAKAYLEQMLALQQRLDEAHYYLGRIAEDAGDLSEAVAEYRLVEDGREFLSASSRVGRFFIEQGELDNSHQWFEQQRYKFPHRSEQLYGMEADLLTRAEELDAAMEVLNQGLAEQPDSSSLRYARSMLWEQQGDLTLMESDLRTLIDRDPQNATALNALGYTLANRTDRQAEALELISRALALQPDEPAILDSMGWVLYRSGRPQEALGYLTRAYAAFPDPEVAAHLGEVLWVTGDTKGATQVWRSAMLKDPKHKVLLSTLKRLGVESLDRSPARPPPE